MFDHDDDGRIDFFEYISCLSAISSKSTKDEKLKCEYSDGYDDKVMVTTKRVNISSKWCGCN